MDKQDEKMIKRISKIQSEILISSTKEKISLKKINKKISDELCKDKEIYEYMEKCSPKKQAKIMKEAENLRDNFIDFP